MVPLSATFSLHGCVIQRRNREERARVAPKLSVLLGMPPPPLGPADGDCPWSQTDMPSAPVLFTDSLGIVY